MSTALLQKKQFSISQNDTVIKNADTGNKIQGSWLIAPFKLITTLKNA